jgi:hypothetical protein
MPLSSLHEPASVPVAMCLQAACQIHVTGRTVSGILLKPHLMWVSFSLSWTLKTASISLKYGGTLLNIG